MTKWTIVGAKRPRVANAPFARAPAIARSGARYLEVSTEPGALHGADLSKDAWTTLQEHDEAFAFAKPLSAVARGEVWLFRGVDAWEQVLAELQSRDVTKDRIRREGQLAYCVVEAGPRAAALRYELSERCYNRASSTATRGDRSSAERLALAAFLLAPAWLEERLALLCALVHLRDDAAAEERWLAMARNSRGDEFESRTRKLARELREELGVATARSALEESRARFRSPRTVWPDSAWPATSP